MIDFDTGAEMPNLFRGAEKKTTVLYDNELYMIKYPDPIREGRHSGAMSYKNNQYSEYIGCAIFRLCGLDTQEVVLGHFTDGEGKRKIVAGCKVFTNNNAQLIEFKMLSNQEMVNDAKIKLELDTVLSLIDSSRFIKDKQTVKDTFWDMFVVDALIGNRDRHLGNFGLIEKQGELVFAPIYDCGSSLSAYVGDAAMSERISNSDTFLRDLKHTEYNITSCFTVDGKRVFYHEIFKIPPKDLADAILRVAPRIDMDMILGIVEDTPTMPDVRKAYLKAALDMRYSLIIAPAYKRISKANTMMLRNNNKTRDEAR